MLTQLYSKTFQLLNSALEIRGKRHQTIVSNIANQETPGFKAVDVDFEASLKNAIPGASTISLTRTHSGHLSGSGTPSGNKIVTNPTQGTARLDGNTVDGQEEMAKLSENAMMFQATIDILAKKVRGLKNVIKEGRP